MTPVPLAHAGGVPELLTVLVPIALAVILLRAGAKKRERSAESEPESEPPESPEPSSGDGVSS